MVVWVASLESILLDKHQLTARQTRTGGKTTCRVKSWKRGMTRPVSSTTGHRCGKGGLMYGKGHVRGGRGGWRKQGGGGGKGGVCSGEAETKRVDNMACTVKERTAKEKN